MSEENKAAAYLNQEPSVKASTAPHETCENVLEFRGVTKVYAGKKASNFWKKLSRYTKWMGSYDFIRILAEDVPDTTVINGADLVVENKPEGEFVVLMGASGCGKSTLLRFAANLDTPTSGQVFVNGLNVNDKAVRLGMVFQEYSSFPWLTVLDNVALGLRYQGVGKAERRARAMEMIRKVGLDGHEFKYARKPTLSGGQLQRVAIARSLLANPQVLLLDEPFGALDVKTRAQMQDLLCALFVEFKPTIILVTHDIDEAVYLADNIFILSKPPSQFAHHVKVDLGHNRDRSLKRTEAFISLKNKVEDIMMSMED